MQAKAYAPAHITGFFMIYPNGSTGAGINLEKGVTTVVKAGEAETNKVEIRINGEECAAQTSRRVAESFLKLNESEYNLRVEHSTALPIGYGLGLSGAGALSLSLALNRALEAGLSSEQCVSIAKLAEIESGTGLGDVVAEQFSGLMIGKKPYPSESVEQIPLKEKYVVCAFFAPIETASVIRDREMKKKINAIGAECMQQLEKKKDSETFIRCCRRFALETGLAGAQVRRLINEIPGACMAMLGQTVFVITSQPGVIERKLRHYTARTAVLLIGERGACLL